MTSTITEQRAPAELAREWQAMRTERPVRARDAAALLGVSECELVASAVGERATRLAGDFRELVRDVGPLGDVMALTRNHACVHEKTGPYVNVSWDGHVGLALGEAIDLRLFFMHWKHGYALTEESARGTLRSLQFFDPSGEAVHKIYIKDAQKSAAFDELVATYASADQAPGQTVDESPLPQVDMDDAAIDRDGFRAAWAAMQDTHEFFGILRRFGVSRTQALRLAERQFAHAVQVDAARVLLEDVAGSGAPIMVFVGSRGCIQIHSGAVSRIKVMDEWVNVLDPGFNLHLKQPEVAAAWVVRKPTRDGIVTSVELFDRAGGTIAMFFGQRKPGIAERSIWRETVARLFPAPADA
jgi:putative hemin transport protein